MKGRQVPRRSEVCRHAWLIIFEQGSMLVLECEFCSAAVSCEVGHHQYGGHSFAFRVARGIVSADELRDLGEWFGHQVGEYHAVHLDMRSGKRHQRRSPVRAA